jgi:hypothetical protein
MQKLFNVAQHNLLFMQQRAANSSTVVLVSVRVLASQHAAVATHYDVVLTTERIQCFVGM